MHSFDSFDWALLVLGAALFVFILTMVWRL
jgi:hypothetical protein